MNQQDLPFHFPLIKGQTTFQATKGKFIGSDQDPVCTCDSYSFIQKQVGPHLGLFCADCGKWHSWIAHPVQHDPNFIITFGTHNGTKISLLPTDYLLYGIEHFSGAMRERFKLALEERGNYFGIAVINVCLYIAKRCEDCVENDYPLSLFTDIFMRLYPKTAEKNIPFWLNRLMSKGMVNIVGSPANYRLRPETALFDKYNRSELK